ncbi:MAG: SpoIIE family protein phosphatase [Spirulina sp. SIO3F2]|nr:SpoIIE family protein phosphatase [Spirulina sp. SIO3F2]
MEHILIIDDDPAIQLLLKRTLTKRGYSVSVASNGSEGLEQAQATHPAMVICDWVMPQMNGIEVCRRIKAVTELSTTFFILLTSKGSIQDRVEGLDAGADDFLCKPIEMFEMEARVRAGLRLHQLSSDLQQVNKKLQTELSEAADYVCSLLPEPIDTPSLKIDFRFLPSSQLGGDSFDYYWLDGDNLAIYLLDVSGHGLRAALPSVSVINLLRSRALKQVDYYRPGEILKGLNEVFQMTQRNDKYFTIWYGVYNLPSRKLHYASAGHPPALLIHPPPSNSKSTAIVTPLKTPGFPVGMFPEVEYVEQSCAVPFDSRLYLFSDGIYEIAQANGEPWGIEALMTHLQNHQTRRGDENLSQILDLVQQINGSETFEDDLSLVEVQFVR